MLLEKEVPAGKPRPKGRPQKNLLPVQPKLLESEPTRTTGDVIEVDESQSKGHEIVISITESTNKIHKPKSYKETVNDQVYGRQ